MKRSVILALVLVFVVPALAEYLRWDESGGDANHRANLYVAVNFLDTPGDDGLGDTGGQSGEISTVWACLGDTYQAVDLYWAVDDEGVPGELQEVECGKCEAGFFWYTHKLTPDSPISVPGNFWIILRVPSVARVYTDMTYSVYPTSVYTADLDTLDWMEWYYDWRIMVEWEADSGVETATWGQIKATF
jgi:hypothetical protein